MSGALGESLAALPGLAAAHLLVSLAALALAVTIALPLALWAARRAAPRRWLLGVAGLVQTVPSLALLALFYPLLLALGAVTGRAIPALGFLPALIALTLYALLPILRNAVAALNGIAPELIEAADGIGMTAGQRLRLVELPLAAPVVMAGIRTAAVWTIGAATLATTVGQNSLGNLIFSGLQTENWTAVLLGCAGSALLALAADGMLALIESGLARRGARRLWLGGGLFALACAAVLAASAWPQAARQDPRTPMVIGAKNFSEQYILAAVMETRLRDAGFATTQRGNLGSAVAFRALVAGDIDVYVDYSGTLWANVLGRRDTLPRERLLAALSTELQRRHGVRMLGPLGFENAYALAMRQDQARRLAVRSIADLASVAPRLRLASDLEFLSRPEWQSIVAAYGLRFDETRAYSPSFMYRALSAGSADVISAFSSDGRIASLKLVLLDDPKHALPGYDAVLLVSPRRAHDAAFIHALRPMLNAIPVERMRAANLLVDQDVGKRTPAEAARMLLGR